MRQPQLPARHTLQQPARRRRRGRRAAAWIAILLAFVIVVVGGYGAYNYWHFDAGIHRITAIIPAKKKSQVQDGAAQNILLVGNDERPKNESAAEHRELNAIPDGGSENTDTMIIVHIPAGGSSATMISLPRDSWVNIPGYGMNKLNAAYVLGAEHGGDAAGARLLITTIQNITGLSIDHYVQVNLLGFYDIAKALGPIQVCLNEATYDKKSGADFVKGEQTLDAHQALSFVRQRYGLPLGDLDREIRQQYFLSVEAHKLLSAGTLLNPVKLNNALTAVSDAIQTDSGLSLLSLANQLRHIAGGNIRAATVPVLGTADITVNGSIVSIVQLNTAAIPAFINRVVGPSPAYATAKAAAPSSVTVTVLNGGGAQGAAAAATQVFTAAGFQTGTPGDTTTTTTTEIEYPTGMEAQAKAVARLLPKAVPVPTTAVTGVTVVLGSDGMAPAPPGTTPTASPTPTPKTTPLTAAYNSKTCID